MEAALCESDAGCLPGRVCENGGCEAPCGPDNFCDGSLVCDDVSGRCLEREMCMVEPMSGCLPGRVCENGGCVDACVSDDDCFEETTCNQMTGTCEEAEVCDRDTQCLEGRYCLNGSCQFPCDCPANDPFCSTSECPGSLRCNQVSYQCDELGHLSDDDQCLTGRIL